METKSYKSISALGWERLLVAALSLIGLGIMAYLTYIHYANAQSFCDISETVSCDVVTTSLYSEIFGLPVSILGLGYFGLVLFLILWQRKPEIWRTIFFFTLFVLFPSLYLSYMEYFVIKAFCVLCETSKLLMIIIAGISFVAMKEKANVVARLAIPVVIAGLVAAGVTYVAQTATTVEKDYTQFVQELNSKGVVYYKSVKCNNCKRQERLFGEAISKLNSVECHPEGENPQPELCLAKGINKTPTFLIEMNDQEVKRLEGLQTLKEIADWAGVPWEE